MSAEASDAGVEASGRIGPLAGNPPADLRREKQEDHFGNRSCSPIGADLATVCACRINWHLLHSTPLAENDALAAGLLRKPTNLLAASGEAAPVIGAAA